MLAIDWSNVSSVISLATESTGTAIREWFLTRFLGNFDLVAALGAFRLWSQYEHRKTARELAEARAQLAQVVATSATNAAASTSQNAQILAEVRDSTNGNDS